MAVDALVTINSSELARFGVVAKLFEPKLRTQLRRRVKEVGALAVDAVKEKLSEPSPADGPDTGTSRAALAKATSLTVSFSKKSAGIRISTRSSGLPAEHKAVLNAYNQDSTRHPVFGNPGVWVEQPGNPYFGAAIIPVADEHMIGAMREALDEACRAIGAVGI